MRKIRIGTKAFLTSPKAKKYIILGSEQVSTPGYVKSNILPKINKTNTEPVPEFWGTLGLADDSKINWSGYLEISSYGNKDFAGVVKDEVEIIKSCFPGLNPDQSSITERFISFDNIDFNLPKTFSPENIPSLRLDLMLGKDEGAIVFYQSDKEDTGDSTIEYILPQATEGYNTNERDRLKYIFDLIPKYRLEEVGKTPGQYRFSTKKETKPFIVKIITFKRNNDALSPDKALVKKDSKEIIQKVEEELSKQSLVNKIAKDHRLLVFDAEANNFKVAGPGNIDTDKKTLFLIHGTFGSTESSFGHLYGDEGTWFKTLMEVKNPVAYRQILAFDHPTIFYGAEENIAELFKQFDSLGIQPFTKDVDFIGTSQGGLLVQYLANLANDRIKAGKAALIASANGVGYLTAGKYIAKFLTILKYLFKLSGMQAQALVAALAQHSAEFILQQPGFQIMTPGNEKLDSIINTPPYRKDTLYLPLIDDYNESIFDSEDKKIKKFFEKIGAGIVDNITKLILGEYNDWVVGTKNQFIVPAGYCAIPGYNPAKYRDHIIAAIHGTCINKEEARKKLEDFLLKPVAKPLSAQPANDYFDAHCHIFGREIISGRIIMLLLEELLEYRKIRKDSHKLPKVPKLPARKSEDLKKEAGSVTGNIIKYFAFNNNSYQMLDSLEEEYYSLNSNVYRYIPLMFDLEMTFRSSYYENDSDANISEVEKVFKKQVRKYIKDIDNLINRFEKLNEMVFSGSLIENEENIKALKIIKLSFKALKVADIDLKKDTVSGYDKQITELKGLKLRYGNNIFPFLAVDPRRENMSALITENVGKGKTFHGIKIYAPNGYSPTDPHLFDDKKAFVNNKSLYSFCIENNIPIMAHCSSAGFSTFTMEPEICGDILRGDKTEHYEKPSKIRFEYNITNGGFIKAVTERAHTLNHPQIWRKVLEKYPGLKICFAHFGGKSEDWRVEIAELLRDFPNAYTDLSCITDKKMLAKIKTDYFDSNDPITGKIMYGSDFFLNMFNKITFKNYYNHFTQPDMFSEEQMRKMSLEIPTRFLGI